MSELMIRSASRKFSKFLDKRATIFFDARFFNARFFNTKFFKRQSIQPLSEWSMILCAPLRIHLSMRNELL
jgi:hypothetical protein